MDRQALYSAVLLARDTDQAKRLWIKRSGCTRNCWLAAAYQVRGEVAVITARFKVGPGFAAKYDMERSQPGRAYLMADMPVDLLIGCDHVVFEASLSANATLSLGVKRTGAAEP
jgi:hypothetical protein